MTLNTNPTEGTHLEAGTFWALPLFVGALAVSGAQVPDAPAADFEPISPVILHATDLTVPVALEVASDSVECGSDEDFLALAVGFAQSQKDLDPDIEAIVAASFGNYLD